MIEIVSEPREPSTYKITYLDENDEEHTEEITIPVNGSIEVPFRNIRIVEV